MKTQRSLSVKQDYCDLISHEASLLKYDLIGFSSLELNDEDKLNLTAFANENSDGDMSWYGQHLDLRLNPKGTHTEAKGAVVLGVYYRSTKGEEVLSKAKIRIARYAHGRDYHRVLRKKGKILIKNLKKKIPHITGRVCVDSAPIPEKILGRMAGLGWQGKNTNLIHPILGSYFFLSVLVVNLEFLNTPEVLDHCRNCRLCVDACPTSALNSEPPYGIDANRCISYLTIEKKKEISSQWGEMLSGWAFGCDICQEVCPYNRNRNIRERDTSEENFQIQDRISSLMQSGELSEEIEWGVWSSGSPLKRVSKDKIESNIALAKK